MKMKSIIASGIAFDFYYENEKQFINLIKELINYTGVEIDDSLEDEDFNWEEIKNIFEDYFSDYPESEIIEFFREPEIRENLDILRIGYNNCEYEYVNDTYIMYNDKTLVELPDGDLEEEDYSKLYIIDTLPKCIEKDSSFNIEQFKETYFEYIDYMDEDEQEDYIKEYNSFVSKFQNILLDRNPNNIFVVCNISNELQKNKIRRLFIYEI